MRLWRLAPKPGASAPKAAKFLLAGTIAVLAMAGFVWSRHLGLHIEGLLGSATKVAALAFAAWLYLTLRPNERLAEMANFVVLWLVFSTTGAVLTYDAAALALPLQDELYRAIDRTLHFDLAKWANVMQANRFVSAILQLDYGSLIVQISCTILWLAHTRTANRNFEFLCASIISFLLCCAISGLLPALGPTATENPTLHGVRDYVGDILALRSGHPVTRRIAELQGIICFPSYHTVLALLLIWAHRGLTSFKPVAVLNTLMLLSVPQFGNHYLTDMIGGAIIAIVSIFIARQLAEMLRTGGKLALGGPDLPIGAATPDSARHPG